MEDQYYDIERRTAIKEEARMFRRKFLTYEQAEVIYSISHRKLRDVASVPDKIHGAGVLAYQNFMDQAAERAGGDFFILPSSIHEVLIVPDNGGMQLKGRGQKKYLRMRSLGAAYREEDLEKICAGEVYTLSRKEKSANVEIGSESTEPKLDMLLDIQKMIAKGKGPGYERWAKVHNIKQMAQTLLFLEEHDLREYEELSNKAKAASDKFAELSERQKALEERLSEITELKKHTINYSKTKDVYSEYRKCGYSKKFFESHREELTLHKAAKEAFSKIKGPIPKIKDLNQEYAQVLQEKKKTYAEFRAARQEMKDIQIAKYNVDQFLKREEQEKQAEREKNKGRSL